MAADDKKSGASTKAGPGGGATSRKSPLSGGTRKPVTIDLSAKDVSKTDKPAAKASSAGRPTQSKATTAKAGAVPPAGKKTSQPASGAEKATPAKETVANTTQTKSAASSAKPASAAAKAGSDAKKTPAGEKATATTASASEKAAADKTKAIGAKEPAKGKETATGSGGKDTPPPPPPASTGGNGGSSERPPKHPKQGAGFSTVLAAGIIGALIVAGAGFGLNKAGVLQMSGAGSTQNAAAIQALLNSSKDQYSQLKKEIAGLKKQTSDSFAAKEAVQGLSAQLKKLQSETSAKLEGAASAMNDKIQEQVARLSHEVKELNGFIANGAAGEGAAVASLKTAQDKLSRQIADLMAASKKTTADLMAVSQKDATQALKGVQDSVADLQKQLLAVKEAPVQLKDLGSQLSSTNSKLDEALAHIGKLTAEVGKLAAEQKVFEGKVDALTKENAETTKVITARLDELEKALGTASAQERAARAIAIASLRNAVDSGENYEAELAAVEAVLPGDAAELAPLKASAASGIPSSAALIAGFGQVARDMSAVATTSDNDDVVERLFSGAKSLVSIRTPNENEGTSAGDVLGTMEARVSAGDLAGAMQAYAALPEPMQKAGAVWAGHVKARLVADELVKKITTQVLKSLVAENK